VLQDGAGVTATQEAVFSYEICVLPLITLSATQARLPGQRE